MRWFSRTRAAWRIRRSPWRTALADLPPQLARTWRDTAQLEYRGIPVDALFFARAAEGLMQFFDAVAHRRTACALPSEAADSVWHAWLRWDPIGLGRFCRKHFGTTMPHVARGEPGAGALIDTLAACTRRSAAVARATATRLPMLFALDRELRMPGGHGYWLRDGAVFHAPMDRHGRCTVTARPHPELTPHALFGAGLLTCEAFAAIGRGRAARRSARGQRNQDSSSDSTTDSFAWAGIGDTGGGGGDCSDSGGAGDSGSDSCGDSGGSCGSSCGGGGD